MLHVFSTPVTETRLKQRRDEIANLYKKILDSDVLILTLGLVECWYDNKSACFLNKAPSKALIAENPERFVFCRLDSDDVVSKMTKAIELLNSFKNINIILTVSPVPLEASFHPTGAVISNCYSKAVLRVASDLLVNKFDNVDYFPSFEIVNSLGINAFGEDNIHVRWDVVKHVTQYMIKTYSRNIKSISEVTTEFHTMLSDNRIEDAFKLAQQCLNTDYRNHWIGFDLLSHFYSKKGEITLALDNALKALNISGLNWGILARIGSIYQALGDISHAVDYYLKAIGCPGGDSNVEKYYPDCVSLIKRFHK